ncbi:Lrp/AsnC family transcriptional regulator [Cohaesibacter gelatinilyticus]|uniref:Transcriptional regulator, AsnC family n=1 Tax=Cohaesibacter gelatinilyticus TaxID=372072 RepID=A0A285PJT4_9HYPH|nr:Lrp/AsnC family transcriptional regulator [Cohaesibacter gelatinilyticus]SNZ21527.1 transcriptional regulator, AsnC family [Cohaesibacter gelatinilyticus]HAT85744.1 Lrp/AsnC family transcriptional regulator [Hyphomicrobiales bacterium]
MDVKDRQIIRALQENGRQTNSEIADLVNLSPSPCLRRIRNLEKSGAIRGYSADADPVMYGLSETVFVRIKLECHNKDGVKQFEQKIQNIDEILECHLLTGPMDYQLKVVVPNMVSYENFIRRSLHPIPGVVTIDTCFVYGTIKKKAAFPELG